MQLEKPIYTQRKASKLVCHASNCVPQRVSACPLKFHQSRHQRSCIRFSCSVLSSRILLRSSLACSFPVWCLLMTESLVRQVTSRCLGDCTVWENNRVELMPKRSACADVCVSLGYWRANLSSWRAFQRWLQFKLVCI